MNRKFGQIGIIAVVVIVALAITGVGFAHWQQTLYMDGTMETGELDWEFITFIILDPYEGPGGPPDYHCNNGFTGPPYWWPDPDGKNVGWGTGVLVDGPDGDGDMSQFNLTLHNVYPSYFNTIAVYVHNNGSIPLVITEVHINGEVLTSAGHVTLDLSGNDVDDFEISYRDNFGVQIDPCNEPLEISFWVHALQDEDPAFQGQPFTFTIEIVGIQWNEYVAP